MFLDQVTIELAAGNGGNGVVSFRREKYVPRGGPDGGDGGSGGSIIFEASESEDTLARFMYEKKYAAENGKNGEGALKTGRSGKDLVLKVPCGTVVYDQHQETIADLVTPGMRAVIAAGGRPGRGNVRFTTSTRQAPRLCTKGYPGEKKTVTLVLKLIADVGIVGMPNAGKSTLLSRISKARPKIADYPFTTLQPMLGIAALSNNRSLLFADLPGLIEGASDGVGLGDKFLRHCERTRMIVHLLDGLGEDVVKNHRIIRNELKRYSPLLAKKPEIVVINKNDALTDELRMKLSRQFKRKKTGISFISAVSGQGIPELLEIIYKKVRQVPAVILKTSKSYCFQEPFYIEKNDGVLYLKGPEIERLTERYDLDSPESLRYFYQIIRKKGWEKKMMDAGITAGTEVVIGDRVFIYQPDYHD